MTSGYRHYIGRSPYGRHKNKWSTLPSLPSSLLLCSVTGEAHPMALLSKTRILLVDDSEPIRTLIKKRLTKLDPSWEISEAHNGLEALFHASAFKPDIAILDLSLPDMLGEPLARHIRLVSPGTRILLCSLSDELLLAQFAKHVQADGFISKTASTEQFRATLMALLTRGPNQTKTPPKPVR
jgi:DNA-binding response OmpR family regulator